jgi:hypothetical protein
MTELHWRKECEVGDETQGAVQPPEAAEQQRRRGLASAFNPVRALDRDAMLHAQAMARAQAQAAATVTIATIVSLVTSAFAFVAAFAWNNVIQQLFSENAFSSIFGHKLDKALQELIYAMFVTLIAVVVIVTLNRIARRMAAKSAFQNTNS